jgi:hypothetical protein
MAIGAASPGLGPVFSMRRYPPGRSLNLGPRSLNSLPTASRNEGLDDASQLLGFRQCCSDRFVAQQRRGHVAKHGFAMRAVAAKLSTRFSVTHDYKPFTF